MLFLIVLVVLCALPVFTGTPTAENAPAAGEEDAWLWLNSLSEEELIKIFGDGALINPDSENNSLVVYYINEYGYVVMISVDQIEICYGKDGKPIYAIFTDPIVAIVGQGWK